MMTVTLRVLAVSALIATAASAEAAAPKVLGTFNDWEAYQLIEGANQRTCYMASQPSKKEPGNVKRGDVLVFVTHRPADKERDVVNVQFGYPLKPGSDVQLSVGDAKFNLFANGEAAWTRGAADDKALVGAMMKGATMSVNGLSERGTKTVDTYSLRGFTAAYREITKACGLT
ncbi:MAG TPA: invasion associated locus B family protein [Alphaproteobacteria bacterium]|nr:invasion associated locus B family protein [Alphaproteobacteria bacterium]